MTEHTHKWKRSPRKHGRLGRFFVDCECGAQRQATITDGHLTVFDTGRPQGGGTVLVSFRLDEVRYKKLRARKVNTRKVVEDHLDAIFTLADYENENQNGLTKERIQQMLAESKFYRK